VRFELTLEIGVPPEEVYAYLADPSNLPVWQEEVEAVERQGEGVLEAGETFTERRSFLGRRLESKVEVIASAPAREFSIRTSAGPVPFTVQHLLEPARGGGTMLTVIGEAHLPRALRLVAGGAARAARRRFDSDFERLKQVLEGGTRR
jgi:uncharacterized protein YndB with AHSA1/START domain